MVAFTLGRDEEGEGGGGGESLAAEAESGSAPPGAFLLDFLSLSPRSLGFLLVSLSLCCDGAMAAVQDAVVYGRGERQRETERGRGTGSPPSSSLDPNNTPLHPAALMYYNNALAALYVFIALLFVGEAPLALLFVERHPGVLWPISLFCLTSTLGQAAIFTLLRYHGALTCAIVTTTRKFLTVLLSVLLYSHSLSLSQWFGVGAVFAGLAADIYVSRVRHPPTLPRFATDK
jgi:drug/metabolite transporter (DMT)-like permease